MSEGAKAEFRVVYLPYRPSDFAACNADSPGCCAKIYRPLSYPRNERHS